MSFALAYQDHVQAGDFEAGGPTGTSNPSPDFGAWEDLQTPQLGKGATWVDGAGVTVVMTVAFDGPQRVDMVSLLDIRCTAPLLFSTIDYYEESTFASAPWVASPEEVDYPTDDFVKNLHFMGPSVIAEGIRMTLSTTATELYLGRLWAGPLWTAPSGIRSRWTHSVIDPGEMGVSRGGQGYPRHRQRRRRLDAELSLLNFEQAFGDEAGTALDLQQVGFLVGTTEPVICLPDTSSVQAIHRLGIYGHLTDPLAIRHVEVDQFDAGMRVNELL